MAYTRQIINVGTTADDGSGDYLRDALIKANTNFENLWQVGAVDTNLDLTGTTIASVTANSNITLDPNGTGKIVLASSVEPDTTDSKDLGSTTKTWNNIHANTVFADKTILNAQASAPSSPVEGTLYYNTSTDNFVGYANGNWSNLSGAVTASSTDTFTNKSGAISQWTNDLSYLTSVSFASLTGKPTTVAGYGITDASDTMPLTLIKTLTANYTVVTADHGYNIRMNSSSNLTVTLVSDGTENIPIGTTLVVTRLNSGDVTFVAGSGATVLAIGTLVMSAQKGKVTVMKTAANTWEINGDLTP